ncbi:MAG: magnesium-translocating P-type ATPase [Clostridia bacterium]|nr:magnesium-translocating P-type ATPase [Clostridia bacterium]
MKNKKEDININRIYGEDCTLNKDEFLKKHNISIQGLTSDEAKSYINKYGSNEISKEKEKKWYFFFLQSLFSPFNSILLVISVVLFYTDVLMSKNPNYANIIVILILVFAGTFLEFFQEYRSNKATEKLKNIVATTCTCLRDNNEIQIPIKDITIGDVVFLSSGNMIPADLRIIEANSLYVRQSTLTGEADAIKKSENSIYKLNEIESITDLDTICFMGSNVISGTAKGIVLKIGDDSYLGKIAETLNIGKPENAFQKGVQSISKLLIKFMLVMIPIVFVFTSWKHENLTSFTFSVAIAIGITPLLLPVILSSSLSRGAINMFKRKTIVKSINSIQSFGSMNILCTDKTGTLTEDKIVLEKYLDINGNEDIRVLKHAFLNSYFQKGKKGSIEEAIILRGQEHNLNSLCDKYKKIDEIPFDFSRRRLSVIVSDNNGKVQMITKGAVEEILDICSYVDYKGQVFQITKEIKNNIKKISINLNKNGFRVIAVCQKNNINLNSTFDSNYENNMVLIGFIGFLDPPKESAKNAIEKLNNSGIRVIVLTGDNVEVTKCICKRVNLKSKRVVLGSELDKLSDLAVINILKDTNILAKLSPIQKSRVIQLLKKDNNIVGYLGDGINDSPSLINSDVGISVDTAVDIAKESADIVLLEKDLNVLLDGVNERKNNFYEYYEIY